MHAPPPESLLTSCDSVFKMHSLGKVLCFFQICPLATDITMTISDKLKQIYES
jgi:hypothetical protein